MTMLLSWTVGKVPTAMESSNCYRIDGHWHSDLTSHVSRPVHRIPVCAPMHKSKYSWYCKQRSHHSFEYNPSPIHHQLSFHLIRILVAIISPSRRADTDGHQPPTLR